MSRLTQWPRQALSRCLMPLVKRAAGSYIAGEKLADALTVRSRLASAGHAATLGYWDSPSHSLASVQSEYLKAIDALSLTGRFADPLSSYLSIKLPALKFSREALTQVAARAQESGVRLHFDAMWPESVDQTWQIVDELAAGPHSPQLSVTLPGRWQRSVADAQWAALRQFTVRAVKGQWPDPTAPKRDLRGGYLEVIDALAGRASHVAVATHDPLLATEAIGRLRAAGTSCELELLYGLPMKASLQAAARLQAPVRIYIPYGEAYMPYALGQMRRNPRVLWWLLRDALTTGHTADLPQIELSELAASS